MAARPIGMTDNLSALDKLSPPSQVVRLSRNSYRLHDDDHWMRRGWIQVAEHPVFGRSIVATQDIPLSPECQRKIDALRVHECSPIGSIESATSIPVRVAETANPEKARYIITVDDTLAFDLVNAWPGLINHAPPDKANTIVLGTRIYQLRDIRKGDHITYDYGLDYWVFQMTHFEKDKWDRQERRVWKKVHKITEDWTVYAEMNLHDLVPFDIMRLVSKYYYAVQKPKMLNSPDTPSKKTRKDDELIMHGVVHRQYDEASLVPEQTQKEKRLVSFVRNLKDNSSTQHQPQTRDKLLTVQPSWMNGPKHW